MKKINNAWESIGETAGRSAIKAGIKIAETYTQERIKYHFSEKKHHRKLDFDEMYELTMDKLDNLENTRTNHQESYVAEQQTEEKINISWEEYFQFCNQMPELPPFLANIIKGCPVGYEPAILLCLLSALGAICFSKVRALYLDSKLHAANLMVIIEGCWGCGKAKIEQVFQVLFNRVLKRDDKALLDDNRTDHVIQTAGINITEAALYEMLAYNQQCHFFMFEPEVKTVVDVLKKSNTIKVDHLRKAFDNSFIYQQNKSKTGHFPLYMNATFTGVPSDVAKLFDKELNGGTVSRFAFSVIPEEDREIATLELPQEDELESMQNNIDSWSKKYAFYTNADGKDVACDETKIDLDYVNAALQKWLNDQYDLYEEDRNSARRDARKRLAAMAFHAAIVIAMLWDNPKRRINPNERRWSLLPFTLPTISWIDTCTSSVKSRTFSVKPNVTLRM